MNILNAVEREAFESPPVFNSVQRKQYFDFPTELRRLAGELRAPTHQLGFLLSAGYLKAAKRFFPPSAFHRRDLEYVARQLELEDLSFDFSDYNPRTRQLHEITIRTFYGFRVFDPEARRLLLKEIAGMVRSQLKPKLMLWLCIDALVREKIEVPSYTRLTKLILGAINRRKQELATIIEHALDQDARGLLDGLLTQEPIEGGTAPGKTSAYKLTSIKKLSESTRPSRIKERVADLDLVGGLYHQLSPALRTLALNAEGIVYYAHSVIKSEIFQVTRRNDPDRYLHVIAFIAHQYFRLQDNLVDVLLTSLQSSQNGALREHKEQCYARREQRNESLKALVGYLDQGLLGTLVTIGAITEDGALSDAEKIASIRTLLATRETQRLLQKNQVAMLKEALVSELSEDDYYRILESKSVWIQNRVGPILKALTFQVDPGTRRLLDAIEHFKEKQGAIDKTAPVTFLDPTEMAAVNQDSKFRVSLYKALLFLHVQSAIKSGGLNLEHSYKYRPPDDYLIDRARWQRDKEQLIERAGLEAFVDPHMVLDELDEALHRQYLISNGNIIEGKNPFIKFGKNGGFTLATPQTGGERRGAFTALLPRTELCASLGDTLYREPIHPLCGRIAALAATLSPPAALRIHDLCWGDRDRLHDRAPQDDAHLPSHQRSGIGAYGELAFLRGRPPGGQRSRLATH